MKEVQSNGSTERPPGLAEVQAETFGLMLEGYNRVISAVEADLKADAAMSLSELEVLIRLANAPDEQRRPRELAEQCVMSSSGCTRMLDRLEQERLVERRPHATDRRGLVITLTKRGRLWLDSVLPGHQASVDRHMWSKLSKAELQQLGATMRKLRDAHYLDES